MNDSKNSSKGLLVLRIPQVIGKETVDLLTDHIAPIADQLGLEPMVLDGGADIRIENGRDALLARICVALEEIAAQGRMPEVSEAQVAPQGLNARPTGLNSRHGITCKGDWLLGTACGKCSRCDVNKPAGLNTERSGQVAGVQPDQPWPR